MFVTSYKVRVLLIVLNSRSEAHAVSAFLSSSVFHVRVSSEGPVCHGVPVLNFVSHSALLLAVARSVSKSRLLLLFHHKTYVPVYRSGGGFSDSLG